MSRSWRLRNVVTGDATMQAGRMDIRLFDGSADELTDPSEILSQHVGKSSASPAGSNPFLKEWGLPLANALGAKMVPQTRAREIGAALRTMVGGLIGEQNRVRLRIRLEPAELLVGLRGSQMTFATDGIVVEASLMTEAGLDVAARAVT